MTSMVTSPHELAPRDASGAPDGIKSFARPICALCGAPGVQLYAALVDWLFGRPGRWGMRTCSSCDIAWLDPQPVAEEIPMLYSRYITHDAQAPTPWLGRLRHATSQCVLSRAGYPVAPSEAVLPRLLAYLPGPRKHAKLTVLGLPPTATGTLLDVGCGNGEFVDRMRALGWQVSGVDPDPAAVAYGQRRGIGIFTGTISDVPESVCFDVITLNHVIEHVADPINFLRECRKRLSPKVGKLIITTPNLNSLGHRWFRKYWRGLEVPRHFTIFSSKGLRDCVERAGLHLLSMSTETRLAPMIYRQSTCAQVGELHIADRTAFQFNIKIAAHFFRMLESFAVRLGSNVGEEIFCTCERPAETY